MPLDTNKTKRAVKMISTFFGTLILFQDKEKEQGLSSAQKSSCLKKKKKKQNVFQRSVLNAKGMEGNIRLLSGLLPWQLFQYK